MFNFFSRLLAPQIEPQRYRVLARRYQIPPSSEPVFREFQIDAANEYEAARRFDQKHVKWTRLSVSTFN